MQQETITKSATIDPEWFDNASLQSLPRVREPLPTVQSYCQTKVFSFHAGRNGLLSAASVLFSLMSKLVQTASYTNLTKLHRDLIHEIKAFESSAHTQGYQSEQILLARYALCAALDESIQQTSWGEESNWHQQGLLYFFQGEVWGGEGFFALLERLSQHPERHVELLELFYVCLSLGFQGKYRVYDQGEQQLQNIIDNVYHTIRIHRDEHNTRLSASNKVIRQPNKLENKPSMSLWFISFFTLLLLTLIYIGFNFMLKLSTAPLYNKLNHINQSFYHYVSK